MQQKICLLLLAATPYLLITIFSTWHHPFISITAYVKTLEDSYRTLFPAYFEHARADPHVVTVETRTVYPKASTGLKNSSHSTRNVSTAAFRAAGMREFSSSNSPLALFMLSIARNMPAGSAK